MLNMHFIYNPFPFLIEIDVKRDQRYLGLRLDLDFSISQSGQMLSRDAKGIHFVPIVAAVPRIKKVVPCLYTKLLREATENEVMK
jgi:hypothetical protein